MKKIVSQTLYPITLQTSEVDDDSSCICPPRTIRIAPTARLDNELCEAESVVVPAPCESMEEFDSRLMGNIL
jgi:hypothetical protein